ncbi:hypothetical protein FSARC_4435 [Fusarium sarcochroum]|uniref:Major facilitator superfamily (MFS) profile domain-containing protein n=1 Tax=Fusarium sarcochroum TaxID=1208366 RepID=A0A8H4U1V9_9HYPO|nr:hypothetical protein FSARC_4435 [Fusarium sarcochroum]
MKKHSHPLSHSVDIGPSAEYLELGSRASLDDGSRYDSPGSTSNYTGAAAETQTRAEADKINELDMNMPLGKAMKKYNKIVRYCLFICIPITAWGYSLLLTGAVNGADSFKKDYGAKYKDEWIIPKTWMSLWMAMSPAGSGIGALVGGFLQDRIGRRWTLMVGSVISALGVTGIFFSFLPPEVMGKRIMYSAGMFLQGMSVGMLQATCSTWVSENAPVALQGPAMAIFPTFGLLGQLLGSLSLVAVNMVEGRAGYASAFAAEWLLAASAFILSWFIPDSPIFLLRKGRDADAMKAAKRLYAPKVSQSVAIERFRNIVEEERSWASNATYLSCFRRKNLRRTMITLLAAIMPSLFGLDLLQTANVFLETVGMDPMTAAIVLSGGIVAGMISNGTGIWTLSRMGVRRTTMVTLCVTAILWAGMGSLGFFKGDAIPWVVSGFMIAIIISLGLGVWPASFAYIGQTSSMQLRAVSTSLAGTAAQVCSAIVAFILPQLFNKDGLYLGAKTAFFYTGTCLIAVMLAFFFLPEMKGRTVADLDSMFAMRMPTRQFKYYKVDEKVLEDDKIPLVDQSYSRVPV